ncbi:MAG TPA: CBS domain-containing protein [Geobacteraceae bacterium]|nr:CBS domain-containing protein [Geobacteraceae bacterium]
MKAKDIMITDFSVVSTHTPLRDAIRMLKKNFGDESYMNAAPGLVVVNDKGELAGILSPLTIIKVLLATAGESSIPAVTDISYFEELCSKVKDRLVGDVMDWQPISVTEDADALDVAELFVKSRFQRIPVVKNKRVLGIIYRSRLLFAMASCMLQ